MFPVMGGTGWDGWVERMYVCVWSPEDSISDVILKDAIYILESRSFMGLEFTH